VGLGYPRGNSNVSVLAVAAGWMEELGITFQNAVQHCGDDILLRQSSFSKKLKTALAKGGKDDYALASFLGKPFGVDASQSQRNR